MTIPPMISVNVPTLNSAKTLGLTLDSVRSQVRSDVTVELIIIDNGSIDRTLEIARSAHAVVLSNRDALLKSRCMGVERSSGKYILLLDSDQVLASGSLGRMAEAASHAGSVFLEEHAHVTQTRMERLYSTDRDLIQNLEAFNFDPLGGTALPRFFRASLLKKAVSVIPEAVRDRVIYRDHAVISYEVGQIDSSSAVVRNAVTHNENRSLFSLARKHFQYGLDDHFLMGVPRYAELVRAKRGSRLAVMGARGDGRLSVATLTALKAIPYFVGLTVPARILPRRNRVNVSPTQEGI